MELKCVSRICPRKVRSSAANIVCKLVILREQPGVQMPGHFVAIDRTDANQSAWCVIICEDYASNYAGTEYTQLLIMQICLQLLCT